MPSRIQTAALLAVASATAVLGGAGPALAAGNTLDAQYSCDYPLVGAVPTPVHLEFGAFSTNDTVTPVSITLDPGPDATTAYRLSGSRAATVDASDGTLALDDYVNDLNTTPNPIRFTLDRTPIAAGGQTTHLSGTGRTDHSARPYAGFVRKLGALTFTPVVRDENGQVIVPLTVAPFDPLVRCSLISQTTLSYPPVISPPLPTPTPSPTPTPGPTGTAYDYTVAGQATLSSLAKGTVALTGSASFTDVKLGTSGRLPLGSFNASFALDRANAKLVAYGFLPVTASLVFDAPAGEGQVDDTGALIRLRSRIKLPSVKLFGLELVQGKSCQTRSAANIPLRSTSPIFLPDRGGSYRGTFAISDLTGCGSLSGLVSPLTASPSNAIALSLTPKA